MTKKKEGDTPTPLSELSRDQIVRKKDGPFYLGYRPSAQEKLIEAGELPMPFPLSENGRALAWTGGQILDHITKMKELAATRAAERAAERANARTPQPAALAAAQHKKVKKVKLRRPNSDV